MGKSSTPKTFQPKDTPGNVPNRIVVQGGSTHALFGQKNRVQTINDEIPIMRSRDMICRG